MRYFWINGRLVPAARASIPVTDSAYLYGIGLFETMRAMGGRVLFFPGHYARLRKNARFLGFRGLKIPLSPLKLEREIRRLLRKNRLTEATIRLTLSRTEAGEPQMVILARPYRPFSESFYRRGAKLVLIRRVSTDARVMARIKTTSYLTKMIGRDEAESQGAVEGILVNESGRITEGASSNLFIVKRGRLITPPLSEGLLPGTRRSVVIDLARSRQLPVAERALRPVDLKRADEIFITSTLKDILPIRLFERKRIGGRCPGPVTRALMKAYAERIRTPREYTR